MNKKLDEQLLQELYMSILEIKSVEECEKYLMDLCTINELKAMSQRLKVAKMLDEEVVYQEIADKTGASTATISRVSRCLNYGPGGYRMILEKIKSHK